MELQDLKAEWTEILDRLERRNRIAWLAYFDGRLSALHDHQLTLDFRDAEKFASGHDYAHVRKPEHRKALQDAIKEVTGEEIEIIES